MVDLYIHKIKHHPSITYIFIRFLITANISKPLQENSQMKRDIYVLITKSDHHHVRRTNIEEWREAVGRALVDPKKPARTLVNLVIWELLLDHNGSLKIGIVVSEDCTTWETVIPSLRYQVRQLQPPARFKTFLQGCTLSESEWLPLN